MKKLIYNIATQEDIETIFVQCQELIDRYEDLSQIDHPKVLSWVHRKIETHISEYTCVWDGNEKVAYFRLFQRNDGKELDDLYVLPEHRGQGIGTLILDKVIRETEDPIFLYVFTKNVGAIELYRRFGFVITEQISNTRLLMARQT